MSRETEEWPPAPVDVAPEGRPVVRAVGLVAALVGIGAAVAFGVLAVSGSVFWSVFRAAMEHWAWD